MTSSTDRIEKRTVLRAPLERVWRAIGEAEQFGSWFGMRLDGPFEAGVRRTGRMVPTTVDPEVAALQKPHEGLVFDLWVERVEPMRLLSFRWHPYAVDREADTAAEPTTLVVIELEEVEGGTRLTVTESGFDAIPLARRAEAFESNESGWEAQLGLVAKYLERTGAEGE